MVRRQPVSVRAVLAMLLLPALMLAACDTGETGDEGQQAADEDTGEGDDAGNDEADTDEAETAEADSGAYSDRFNLVNMAHTSPETVRGLQIEVETTPWDGESDGGPYSYASAPCNQDAPINNVSTNLASFNTRMEGSRSPASTRMHPFEFEVESIEEGQGELTGTIELTVCQPMFGVTPDPDPTPDEEKDRIVFEVEAEFTQPTEEETTYSGTFTAVEATGAYEGIQAEGQIAGYLMCLGPEPCAQQGEFRDAQVVMIGTYEPPEGALD